MKIQMKKDSHVQVLDSSSANPRTFMPYYYLGSLHSELISKIHIISLILLQKRPP